MGGRSWTGDFASARITEDALEVRNILRTRRFAWDQIKRYEVVLLRPHPATWALAIWMSAGYVRVRAVQAAGQSRDVVATLRDAVAAMEQARTARCGGEPMTISSVLPEVPPTLAI
jgi:hypothetical protein